MLKCLVLTLCVAFFAIASNAQSRLTIIDRNSNVVVKRLDLTRLFFYKVRYSEL